MIGELEQDVSLMRRRRSFGGATGALADAGRDADGELACRDIARHHGPGAGARPFADLHGATSIVSTPRNAPAPMVVRCLVEPS